MTTAVPAMQMSNAMSPMNRSEIERLIEPMLRRCIREFGDLTPKGISDELCKFYTKESLQPDIRRVSLLVSLAQSVFGDASGEGLEVGSGYCFVIFPMARFFPRIHWSAVDHPGRAFLKQPEFQRAFREYNCEFVGLDLTREPLPFPSGHFQIVTFSEVLEHLPVERVNFVLSEIARVIRPGGVLLASSPNQASLENRLRLLKGKSILAMPEELPESGGIFGHIRLYTPAEMNGAMSKLGFGLERSVLETNISGFRGKREKSWRSRVYELYQRVEAKLAPLRNFGDTWYMVFRKDLQRSSA